MRECIFHFKVIRQGSVKSLRALLLLPPDREPSVSDFIGMFGELGYRVRLENERELIFGPADGEDDYKLDITRIEIKGETEEKAVHDGELKAIMEHLVKSGW